MTTSAAIPGPATSHAATSASGGEPPERAFGIGELFFSTTDRRGIIQRWNSVFERISAYSGEELQGKPHNLIRHPSMPRGVFRLLWEALEDGRPFAGYVKNRAKDGAPYWVFTLNVPVMEGFLSVRLKPTGPHFAAVRALYAETLELESNLRAGGATAAATAAEGAAHLLEKLRELGHPDYETFSAQAFAAEMRARDEAVRREGLHLVPEHLSCPDHPLCWALIAAHAEARKALSQLSGLFRRTDQFAEISRELEARTQSALAIGRDFHLNALNANIAAQHLGHRAVSLGTVANFLGIYGANLSSDSVRLDNAIGAARTAAHAISAALAAARLQVEMLLAFLAEVAARGADPQGCTTEPRLAPLVEALEASLGRAAAALGKLKDGIEPARQLNSGLVQTVLSLEVTQIAGLTEAARVPDAGGLRTMFMEFRRHISTARGDLYALADTTEALADLATQAPTEIDLVGKRLREVHSSLAPLRA
jgi:PAS domain S-box-containing protein